MNVAAHRVRMAVPVTTRSDRIHARADPAFMDCGVRLIVMNVRRRRVCLVHASISIIHSVVPAIQDIRALYGMSRVACRRVAVSPCVGVG